MSARAAINLPLQEPVRGYGFSNIFPKLFFSQPVGIAIPPGQTNRLFVVEQTGRVMLVENSSLTVFLDLRDRVSVTRESGLLSLAFHPNFAANGRFFTYRILVTPEHHFRFRLSEFRCDPAASSADPRTEKILISDFVMDEEHNAGDLKFGPDGFLYLAIGEEISGSPETLARPQRIDQGFFGGILRIDVDGREDSLRPNRYDGAAGDYWIPKDNPFAGAQSFLGQSVNPGEVRTEFYAVGLRNPWRMNFEPHSGRLICADVGSAFFEEINIIERGGNYGWPYQEGPQIHEPAPAGAALLSPAHAYPREAGSCIIGGLIYRGAEFPELYGKYLFADFVSGDVWARNLDDPASPSQWLGARTGFSTFAYAPDGGVLLANHTDGSICRLVSGPTPLPERLSETGAFRDLALLDPVETALPFEVNSPLWSDGADKKRWVDFSRATGKIAVQSDGRWLYPAGAVWIKHFELEMTNGVPESRRRLETRLLVKTGRDVYGLTYRWQGADALRIPPEGLNEILLLNDGGTIRHQVWRYPSADECRTCHNRDAGYILGFNARQLNRTNQLEFFASRGFFDSPLDPQKLPKLAGLDDPHAPLEHKVRSYLESNCVQCHQPGGRALTDWDARSSVPIDAAKLIGASPVFFPPPMKIVDPGRPWNSLLLNKASTRTPGFGMPPLASSVVDRQFTNILAQWIAQLNPSTPLDPTELPPEALNQESRARFLGSDTNTLGSWRRRYGRDGYWLVGEKKRFPEWFALVARGAEPSPFVDETFLPQALERSEGDGRFASALYGRRDFSIQMAPTDARPAVVGFYLLDFNYRRRVLDIVVENSRGSLIDRRIASGFSRGQYLFWEIAGPVTFRFVPQAFAAGVSAIFVDRGLTSLDLNWNNLTPASPDHMEDAVLLDDSDRDGISNGVEFCLGFNPFDRSDAPHLHCSATHTELSLKFEQRSRGAGIRLQFDLSEDLSAWRRIEPMLTEEQHRLVISIPSRESRSFVRFRPVRER